MTTNTKKVDLKQIIEKCEKCEKPITVKEVVEIAQGSLSLLYNQGTILKRVEKTLGEKDWNILLTSVLGTFLSSLYATVELGGDLDKSAQFGKEIGASVMAVNRGDKK